ncbi:MAG: cyclopropane-fatty-acyl-phospholipid synthase family protein [Alphaproteobacteria bacterium]|jgi:cyclopropane-fatty-acyl-phospholipid synthase|nr:cyclopropane-fatty-acyl-phospholipid synthase family protein [Alphaproteobacteria bacterium]MDP7221956.1 cyclopropane-fatty-acyl-phospholipid synthase family protein [Alphaproteobacteria bacterium]
MLDKIASDQLFRSLDKIESGSLELVTPDGQTRFFAGKEDGVAAHIELRDWRVISNMMRRGDIGFAEDYRSGLWDSNDLVSITALGLQNRAAMDRMVAGHQLFRTIAKLSYLLRLNTVKGSKKNIHAHYDLGNDFYDLWLDPTMTYSSAIFDGDDDLVSAQRRKYDRLIDRMDGASGKVLEIGCGWGGFAERALARGDFAIKGVTLSEEQHDYANARLQGRAEIVLEDYRHQKGLYDHIVSIEMFEAVGERYWATYFAKIKELLSRNGRALIQTITMNEKDFPRYRKGGDFIRSYIFPGGMLPSPSRFKEEAEKAGLRVCDQHQFGLDYARTLKIWLDQFDRKIDDVKALGYDDGFIRLWRFYLAACAAGFKTGRTDVMQVELRHA